MDPAREPSSSTENHFGAPFVWKGAMMSAAAATRTATWEARLRLDAAERTALFVGLAGHGLDRSYRLAGLFLRDAAEAEDAVGDALERAWARLDQLRDPAGFEAWFDRILVNACRDRLRRRQRVQFVALAPTHDREASDDPFRRVVDQDALLAAMADLSDDERLVIVLRFWADLSLEAIARRLGWPLGTVKSKLHRALARMRPAAGAASVEVAK